MVDLATVASTSGWLFIAAVHLFIWGRVVLLKVLLDSSDDSFGARVMATDEWKTGKTVLRFSLTDDLDFRILGPVVGAALGFYVSPKHRWPLHDIVVLIVTANIC